MNSTRTIGILSALLGLSAFIGVLVLAPVDIPQRRSARTATPPIGQLIRSLRTALIEDRPLAALNLAEQAVEHHPSQPDAWMWLGIIADLNRDRATAVASGQRQLELLENVHSRARVEVPSYTAGSDQLYRLAWGHLLMGRESEARSRFADAARALEQETEEGSTQFSEYNLACYRAMAGELDRAAEHFEKAVENGYRYDNGWWKIDPDLDPIREHPAFRRAAARVEAYLTRTENPPTSRPPAQTQEESQPEQEAGRTTESTGSG